MKAKLADLRAKTDVAAQWRTADHAGQRYFYHASTKERRWDVPAVVTEVTTPEFKAKLFDLSAQLKGATASAGREHLALRSPAALEQPDPRSPDLSRMVLTTASAVKDALCDFNRLISDKGLSTAYQASYHIVFAREVIGEAEWHSQINAMGIALHSKTDGLPVAKIPPFAEPGRGSSFVPAFRVTFQNCP